MEIKEDSHREDVSGGTEKKKEDVGITAELFKLEDGWGGVVGVVMKLLSGCVGSSLEFHLIRNFQLRGNKFDQVKMCAKLKS